MANIPGAVSDPSRVRGEAIEFKSGGDTIQGYLARPSQPGRNPGIVVIHEAFGLVEHIRDIARRFANIGYNALAPDLYTRAGGPANPDDIATVMPVMFAKSDTEAVRDLEAAAAHLRGLPSATAKVGAIGFCSGAGRPFCSRAAATRWMPRSTAGAGSSIARHRTPRPRPRVRPR
jgi:carboxymethylenebutenolidase